MTYQSRKFSIFFALLIFLNVAGCHHSGNGTDRSLAQVDSLLNEEELQQALERLGKIDTMSMSESQTAYYYLLLTQAKYKNYIVSTTDKEINFAVSYYENSDDESRYIRALTYQGAVSEELGNLEKAVDCYHKAECLASDFDLYYLAYTKMRLGFLYHIHPIGSKTIALEKFQEAYQLFKALGDKKYQLSCLVEIGGLYRGVKDKADSSVLVLNEAFKLAKELNNSGQMFCIKHAIADYYNVITHQYDSAKKYALQALEYPIPWPRAHHTLVMAYSNLHQPDSAQYYFDEAPQCKSQLDSVTYFWAKSDLEKAKHNPEAAFKYYLISDSISDAMLINGLNDQLLAVEKKYDMQTTEMENLNLQSELKSWIIVAVALVCLALALVLVVWRYRNRVKMKAQEYELIKSDLDASLSSLENLKQAIGNYESKLAHASTTIQNLNSEYSKVKTELRQNTASETAPDEAELKGKKKHADEMRMIVDQQIKVVHQLILWSYEFENDGATFSKKFRQLMTMDSNNSASSTTYWNHLHLLVNDLYDNVLDKAQEMAEGKLKTDEINFLALSCCGYSRTVIMICMGYKNIVSVSNKKAKIARKMNVKSLDTFVADYQSVQ